MMEFDIPSLWPRAVALASFAIAVLCSGHAVLHKRDSRAATGWVGIIWLTPILGSILYLLLGINRVSRLARTARGQLPNLASAENIEALAEANLHRLFPEHPGLPALARLGSRITKRGLLFGNRIVPLENGDAAYARMLSAIDGAHESVTLSTYIFDNGTVGRRFIDALSRAQRRGVRVRVLIDDIGLRYSWRSVLKRLNTAKIPVARFMGAFRPRTFPHMNLRKHRKILVTDGRLAFTGGMNIRDGHLLSIAPTHPIQDIQFEIEGPLVTQLQEVFAGDWAFTTQEILQDKPWFFKSPPVGTSVARVITDGPDEDLNKLPLILEGAISTAQRSIWIVTPYFLPDTSLATALCVAAGKGVSVQILLPQRSNLPFVQWASNPLLVSLLGHGCRIWFSAPPFDHSKLVLVDEVWALFGSANWDPRSLRLNFELSVECYDLFLGQSLKTLIVNKMKTAHEIHDETLRNRAFSLRLRDGIARLFSPYL